MRKFFLSSSLALLLVGSVAVASADARPWWRGGGGMYYSGYPSYSHYGYRAPVAVVPETAYLTPGYTSYYTPETYYTPAYRSYSYSPSNYYTPGYRGYYGYGGRGYGYGGRGYGGRGYGWRR